MAAMSSHARLNLEAPQRKLRLPCTPICPSTPPPSPIINAKLGPTILITRVFYRSEISGARDAETCSLGQSMQVLVANYATAKKKSCRRWPGLVATQWMARFASDGSHRSCHIVVVLQYKRANKKTANSTFVLDHYPYPRTNYPHILIYPLLLPTPTHLPTHTHHHELHKQTHRRRRIVLHESPGFTGICRRPHIRFNDGYLRTQQRCESTSSFSAGVRSSIPIDTNSLTLTMSLSLQKTVIKVNRPGYELHEQRYAERITWAPVGSVSYPPGHTASSSYQTSPLLGDQRSQHGKSRTSCMYGPILMR